jgi:hypothetical protein
MNESCGYMNAKGASMSDTCLVFSLEGSGNEFYVNALQSKLKISQQHHTITTEDIVSEELDKVLPVPENVSLKFTMVTDAKGVSYHREEIGTKRVLDKNQNKKERKEYKYAKKKEKMPQKYQQIDIEVYTAHSHGQFYGDVMTIWKELIL